MASQIAHHGVPGLLLTSLLACTPQSNHPPFGGIHVTHHTEGVGSLFHPFLVEEVQDTSGRPALAAT
eukprot:1588659-Prorocentrum_lima.AAC.1